MELTAIVTKLANYAKRIGGQYVLLGSILSKFVTFFGSAVVIRLLSKTEYGVLGYAENIYSYFYILAGLGLVNSVLRFVVLQKDAATKYSVYRLCLRRGTIYNLIIVVVACCFCWLYPIPGEYESYIQLCMLMCLAIFPQYLIDCCFFCIRSLFNNRAYAISTICVSAGMIASRVIGASFAGVYGVVIVLLLFECIAAWTLDCITKKLMGVDGKPSKALEPSLLNEIKRYGFKCMASSSVWVIFTLNNVLMLSVFQNDPEVIANYRVASVIPSLLSLFGNAIGVAVSPYFTQHDDAGDYVWIKKRYREISIASFSILAVIAIALILAAPLLVEILYGHRYLNVVPTMRLLIIGSAINSGLRYPSANILTAIGLVGMNTATAVVGIAMQVLLDAMLIPSIGLYGAGISYVIVYLTMALLLIGYMGQVIKRRLGNAA